jgi:FMN phosphatase YigB (HAD superfamily)
VLKGLNGILEVELIMCFSCIVLFRDTPNNDDMARRFGMTAVGYF